MMDALKKEQVVNTVPMPLGARLVVKKYENDEITKSGIIIPNMGQRAEDLAQGEILAVGPGSRHGDGTTTPINLSVGELIGFNATSGHDFVHMDEKLLILNEDEVLVVFDD